MRYTIALIAALLLNSSANLMFKFGMKTVANSGGLFKEGVIQAIKTTLTSPQLIIGLLLFGINAPIYMYALQKYKVSVAYPIMVGCSFAIIATVAAFSGLGERLSYTQWFGAVMIFSGVVLVAR